MGYELRRELREALGPTIIGLQRAVALEIADDARDETRVSMASLDDLARWTAAKNASVVRNALKRLAAEGWEFRVPIGKGSDGRILYAHPGRTLTFRVPDFDIPEGVATARPLTPRKGEPLLLLESEGGAVAPSEGAGAPSEGAGAPSEGAGATPLSSSPQSPHLSLVADPVARLVAETGVVEERGVGAFIDWTKARHRPQSLGWWRTVAANGDLVGLAAEWRECHIPSAPSASPWCGCCSDERKRQAEGSDGKIRRCPVCHPLRDVPVVSA